MGSLRVPRAFVAVPAPTSFLQSSLHRLVGESRTEEASGATPEITRRRRVLPSPNPIVPAPGEWRSRGPQRQPRAHCRGGRLLGRRVGRWFCGFLDQRLRLGARELTDGQVTPRLREFHTVPAILFKFGVSKV
jgi:hypothetical protein